MQHHFTINKLFKALRYWSRDILNFDFLDKGLGIVSSAHFVYDFSTKLFPFLYSINWPTFIPWLPLLLQILGNMSIAIVCYPGCDVMAFEINLTFLIESFFLHDQKVWQKLKYLENEKSFWGEIKSVFTIFKGLSVIKNCFRT